MRGLPCFVYVPLLTKLSFKCHAIKCCHKACLVGGFKHVLYSLSICNDVATTMEWYLGIG